MNASPNEVTLILDAIDAVRQDVQAHRKETAAMDVRINGRIRKLERFRWQLVGAATLATAALGIALRFL